MADFGQWRSDQLKAYTPPSAPAKKKPTGQTGRGGFLTSLISEGGAAAGGATGAAIGSVVPGIGTAVGGLAGAVLGAIGGRLTENKVRDNKFGGWSALQEGALNAVPVGMIAGKGAKGFKAALGAGKTFKGVDDLARFEIDDSKSFIKPKGLLKASTPGQAVPLQELLNHPELYKNYPDIRTLKVRVDGAKSQGKYDKFIDRTSGEYSPVEDTINLTSGGKSTLLHEVQHAVQEREGFAKGGSADKVFQDRDMALNKLSDEQHKLQATPTWQKYDAQVRSAGMGGMANTLFNAGDDTLEALSKMSNLPVENLKKLREFPGSDDFRNTLKDIKTSVDNVPNKGLSDFDGYQRLAGEAEARAVSARMDMPMTERYKDDVGNWGFATRHWEPLSKSDEMTTVYRALPKGKTLRQGDFVTQSAEYAKKYGDNVSSFQVPTKDLRKPPANSTQWKGRDELVYNPDVAPKRSTFYDSLDVPKVELIVKPAGVGGKSMSVAPAGVPNQKYYHGSNENFDNFDPTKLKSGVFGKAAYLTNDSKSVPSTYGNLTHEFSGPKLNLHTSSKEADFNTAKQLYKQETGKELKLPKGEGWGTNDSFTFWRLHGDSYPEVNRAKDLLNRDLKGKGYDGIKEGDTIAVFDPTKLKKTGTKYSDTFENIQAGRVGADFGSWVSTKH